MKAPAKPAERQFLTAPNILLLFRRAVVDAGSIAAYARQHKLSPTTVSAILQGIRPVTPRVAQLLGYEPIRVYRRLDPT
jgi:hypothetical protein